MTNHQETDEMFDVLSDRRRRLVLHVLLEANGPVDLETLSRLIAGVEGDEIPSSFVRRAPARVGDVLHHTHLPKMDVAGVVVYDREDLTVRLHGPTSPAYFDHLDMLDDGDQSEVNRVWRMHQQ